jgi:hypothetical protein
MNATAFMVMVTAIVSLGGCAAFNPQQRRSNLQSRLKSWYGWDVDRLVAGWGAPAGRSKLSTGAEVLTYRLTTQMSIPHSNTINSSDGTTNHVTTYSQTQLACEVTFISSVNGKVIETGSLGGNLGACEQLVRPNPEGMLAERRTAVPKLKPLATNGPQPELTGVWLRREQRCVDGVPTAAGQAIIERLNADIRLERPLFQVDLDSKTYLVKNMSCMQKGELKVTPFEGRYSIDFVSGTGENCPPLPAGIQRTYELRGDEIIDYNFEGGAVCNSGHFAQIFKRTATDSTETSRP